MKKVFTTGQVAKICKVAPRTVSKWFDSGRLRGYRIPGSQDRRIPQYEQTLIIDLASEDEAAPETLVNFGFSESFKKPFDVALLAERIQTLVDEKRENS